MIGADSLAQRRGLVSVVTIFLDAEQFLAEAIDSVLRQTYRDWELLLVDDGSRDASSEIARRYAARHSGRIRYLEHAGHQNRGMSESRNVGIAAGRGEYFAFLDADDVWLPENLAAKVALMEANAGVAMVAGATESWYSWTGKQEDRRRNRVEKVADAEGVIEPPTLLLGMISGARRSPCTCSILVPATTFQRVGPFVDRFKGMFEDQAWYAKLFLSESVFVSHECHCRYRRHPKSATFAAHAAWPTDNALFPGEKEFLEWLRDYLNESASATMLLRQTLAARLELGAADQPRHVLVTSGQSPSLTTAARGRTSPEPLRKVLQQLLRRKRPG